MIRKFVEDKRSQNVSLILNILILLISVFCLGTKEFGIISLIITGVIINQKLSSLFGGRAINRLSDKYNQASLLVVSYAGILFIHLLTIPFYLWFKPFDIQYLPDFFLISLMNALFSTNQLFILSKKKETIQRVLEIFQPLMQISLFILFIFKTEVSTEQFLIAFQLSLFMAMAGSMGVLVDEIPLKTELTIQVLIAVLKDSFRSSLNDWLQFLSIRISLFFIPIWLGYKVLGEFTLLIFLAENLYYIGKTKATVELAYCENSEGFTKQLNVSGKALYRRLLLTLSGIIILFIVFLALGIFSIPTVMGMLALIPGVLLFNLGKVATNYFPNTIEEIQFFMIITVGLIIAGLISFFLIPVWGLTAASIATTLGYCGFFFAQNHINRNNLKVSFK